MKDSDMKNGLSRRHFFKSAAITGVAASGILPSIAAQAQSNSANNPLCHTSCLIF